jgi:pimeloyl-ACP methyl ester carboxylesterase
MFMAGAMLGLCSCSPPWSLSWLSHSDSYQQINRTALSGDAPSDLTSIVLRRYALFDLWKRDPARAIAVLHDDVVRQPARWSDLFALAELSYLQGRKEHSTAYWLAAAVYAYAFLFPDNPDAGHPNPFDPRFRQACDIYNLALSDALAPSPPSHGVEFTSARYALPFGSLNVTVDEASLRSDNRSLHDFEPTYALSIDGPQNIYHNPGLGAPLAAAATSVNGTAQGLQIAPTLRIPTNAFLTIPNARQQLTRAVIQATLAIHTIFDTEDIQIGHETVPLEYDQTAARALSLIETRAWGKEYSGFLDGTLIPKAARLVALEPHRRGRRPVVLVHGTASSPFRWADMVNDLLEDPSIRDHFEFWFFSYATGNPIPYSALQLRQAIEIAVSQTDPRDPALHDMTVIGHSQGGLLAKMLVIDPGDALWDSISRRPFNSLALNPGTRTLLQASLFPKPLPDVRHVIFIATPHRGSYVAAFSISQFIGRFVRFPIDVTNAAKDILTGNGGNLLVDPSHTRLGSVYGMLPGNPFINALASVPVAPNVEDHSIIPILGDKVTPDSGDGVVKYASAHIDHVDSELVVPHSGHSTQSNPLTVAEVRRILLLELNDDSARSITRH